VTVLGALLEHSLAHAVWHGLGVELKPSPLIKISEKTTALGPRKLRIYWLSEGAWSKRLREKSGGMEKILRNIAAAGVIDGRAPVCVMTNKDDASETNPWLVHQVFPTAQVMPHRVEGQNRFRGVDQLIHTAALNAHTPDIRFLERVLRIDGRAQRIARTGSSVYQSLMRLSLRDPLGRRDVTLVVMDKDVAEWLPQWFAPATQIEVAGIYGGVAAKRETGRPTLGRTAMTNAERQKRWRDRQRGRET
jgi:hypothetical protein